MATDDAFTYVPITYKSSTDYRDIDPRFGTLEDWERLVKGLHNRGMKLMQVSCSTIHTATIIC